MKSSTFFQINLIKNRLETLLATTILVAGLAQATQAADSEKGFVSLFDGKTLDGWKVGENASAFTVKDGVIVMNYLPSNNGPAHLFYDGTVKNHNFKNFDLRVDVMTFPGANSGIYFHTQYQPSDWPKRGLECQVNNSHGDWRRTGSVYAIKNLTWGPEKPEANTKEDYKAFTTPPVKDNEWYTQEIIYRNGNITVKLNGQVVNQYQIVDADKEHTLSTGMIWQPSGTFALQGHPPMQGRDSKVSFKNIRVKILDD